MTAAAAVASRTCFAQQLRAPASKPRDGNDAGGLGHYNCPGCLSREMARFRVPSLSIPAVAGCALAVPLLGAALAAAAQAPAAGTRPHWSADLAQIRRAAA